MLDVANNCNTVGVVGAAGYSGGELCRILLNHPNVGSILPTSRGGLPFERVHRNLAGSGLQFLDVKVMLDQADDLDVVFFCTPPGEAMQLVPQLIDSSTKMVDISADFRFKDSDIYDLVYNRPHACPELLDSAACGITELNRQRVRHSQLVANSGCYVIATMLALAPLIRDKIVDLNEILHIHAVNGTTGAGSVARKEIMHAEVFGSMLPYSMEGHRHSPEMEARIGELAGRDVRVSLGTAHGNFARGLYVQMGLSVKDSLRRQLDRTGLLDLYTKFYGKGHAKEYFVLVNDLPKLAVHNEKEYDVYPNVASVIGSNFCHIGVDYDMRHGVIKLVSVVDNIVKGAAGSAVQNMNVMLDLDETAGLRHYGL